MKAKTRQENKTGCSALVLIAAKPNRLRDSLQFLLKTMPEINIIGLADDSALALRMISERHPALVLLDTNLPGDEMTTMLKQIKASGYQSRCLVLSDTFEQQQSVESAGADMALVRGFSVAELFEVMEKLLPEQEAQQIADDG